MHFYKRAFKRKNELNFTIMAFFLRIQHCSKLTSNKNLSVRKIKMLYYYYYFKIRGLGVC